MTLQFLQPPSESHGEHQNADPKERFLYPDYGMHDKISPSSSHYAHPWLQSLKTAIISLLFMLPIDYLTPRANSHSSYFRIMLIAIFFVIFNVLLYKINRARTAIYNFKMRAKVVAIGSLMVLTFICAFWQGQGGHEVLPLLLLLLLIVSVTIILTLLFGRPPVRPLSSPPPYNPYHPESSD